MPRSPRFPSLFALLPALALLSAPALVQAAPATGITDEGGQISQTGDNRAVTFVEDDDVDGDLPRPSGERISARHSAKHPSLIKLRVRFNDHLIRLSYDISAR